jgi:hypothetical protein
MIERTTVRLPDELVGRAKRKALAEGCSLTALIENGLRRVLDDRSPVAQAKPTLPPVSSTTGGLLPEVDFDDAAALQEADDIDAAGHLR